MSFQDAILREAGPNTLETIKRLEKKLGKTAGTLRTVVQNNTLISVSKHAHTHATGGTMQTGVGTDPIGPYDYTWTGRHTFTPAEDEVPVTINASGASHTADVFRVFDNASGRSFEMAAGGKGGFNAPTMNAQVNIRAGVAIVDPLTLGSGPDLWLRHEELRIAADAVPLNDGDRLPDGAFTWPDASGNSRDYSEQATEDPSPI